MYDVMKTRDLYESYVDRGRNIGDPGAGRVAFVNRIRHGLGLCDKNGHDYKDEVGNRVFRECPDPVLKCKPEQFSIKELMESIVGPGASQMLQSGEQYGAWAAKNFELTQRDANYERRLMEAPGVGISPSAYADINAWTSINSGLIERRILEPFQNPEYIGSIICPDEQTRIAEGQKVIGSSRIGPKGLKRSPNQPHARAGLQERWVVLPRTNENALAVDVTFEAGFFDLTGQVLQEASDVGEWLAYAQELDKIDSVIGVTGSTGASTDPNAFNYKGTTYALFATAEALPIPKNSQVNGLTNGDFTTIQNSWLLSQRMRDPETQTRVRQTYDTILTSLVGSVTADLICGADDTQRRTTNVATQATAVTLNVQNTRMNPAGRGGRFGVKNILTSALVDQRMTDATGLNLSATNAAGHWFHLQAGRSHKCMVNWPLTVQTVPAGSSYMMTDRRLVQSTFASLRYTPSVWHIWGIVQNTNV